MKKAAWLAVVLPALVWAGGQLPQGWRELKFGMGEAQVQKKVLEYRTQPDREWEQTPLTAMYVPDLAKKKLVMRDLDSARYHQWMIGHLDEGAATVRTFFAGGKLFAVQAMGTVTFNQYVEKAAAAYGSPPQRAKFTVSDETSTGKPEDSKEVDVAYWKGPSSTALIFQVSGWGPELLVISNDGLGKVNQSLKRPQSAGEGATRF